MSDYIPFDIQAKIMKNLPSKSLLQFRSVSKAWKSLIDSFEFIADHHQHACQRYNYLLARDFEHKYVSIVDDDTFPRRKFSLTLPMSAKLRRKPRILGSSQGLFCLYGCDGTPYYSGIETAAIWNPAIRKLVDIDKLPHVDDMFRVTVGFGVCPHTLDPKIVILSYPWTDMFITAWQVEVFRLSSGAWTSLSVNLPPGTVAPCGNQVAIDKFIYWPAAHNNVELLGNHLIMSFDLTSEEFTEIHLPDDLALNCDMGLNVYKLKESLVVLQSDSDKYVPDFGVFHVWIMENGVQKSFKKIYTINFYTVETTRVLEFRNSGEPIVLISDDYELYNICEPFEAAGQNHLYVYEPNSSHFSYIGISPKRSAFLLSSYAETLLLLDH